MQRVEKVIEIDAPIERVFDLFSDFENFPGWMRHIRDVHYSGRRYTRWTADAPLGTSVEWEAETTDFDPPHRIAWRSVRGDVDTEGEVTFRETRRGTTLMHVVLGYQPPAGRLGALVASLFGKDPEQQLDEDLERFAEVAERARRRERTRRPERLRDEPRRREQAREFYDERARNIYDDARRARYRGRDTEEDFYRHEAERERERRRDFDDGRADARRFESGPVYEEQRDARRFRRDERHERRLDFDDEWDERLGRPMPRDRRDEDGRAGGGGAGGRHALTPRERERERHERKPDFDYPGEAFRRGIDKLMEDPPSNRWRRWD